METHIRPEIAALCRLQPISMAALAKTIGLQKSNLLAALAGRRPMPADNAVRLWNAIGIDEGGGLAHDRVHRWKVRHSDDFELVERVWFSAAERFALRGEAQNPSLSPLAYLVAGIGASGDQEIFAIVSGSGMETLSDDRAVPPPLSISSVCDITNATLTPDTVRKLLATRTEPNDTPETWAQFVRQAKSRGLTPDGIWTLLKNMPH